MDNKNEPKKPGKRGRPRKPRPEPVFDETDDLDKKKLLSDT